MLMDKIKAFFNKEKDTNSDSNALEKTNTKLSDKKKIENLVVFVIILIITLIIINLIIGDGKESVKSPATDSNKKLAVANEETVNMASVNSQDELTAKLEQILEKIQGVGKVKVLITYSQTSQTVPMYNEDTSQKDTEETDTSGGKRKIIETDVKKDIIYEEADGEKVPITQSIISPKVEGAIITAEGAGNATTKANIIQAVEAVTGIASHKIQVFAMEV